MLDLPTEKVADAMRLSGKHSSIDAPFVQGEEGSLIDVLADADAVKADSGLMSESLNKEIERALSTLTERERTILKLSFGIRVPEMSLEEIGDKFGLTRERVRQIREKAIRKLRSTSRSNILKTYL